MSVEKKVTYTDWAIATIGIMILIVVVKDGLIDFISQKIQMSLIMEMILGAVILAIIVLVVVDIVMYNKYKKHYNLFTDKRFKNERKIIIVSAIIAFLLFIFMDDPEMISTFPETILVMYVVIYRIFWMIGLQNKQQGIENEIKD